MFPLRFLPIAFCIALASGLLAESSIELRGFGKVVTHGVSTIDGLESQIFVCESPEKARVFLQKMSRDLTQSSTVKVDWQAVDLAGSKLQVLVRPGLGSYLPLVKGNEVRVFASPKTDDLAKAFAPVTQTFPDASGYDPDFRYPRYLDKFSHYGIGSWYPPYWDDEFTKGKPNSVDDHFAFAREHDLVLQPNSGGFLLTNIIPKLKEYDRPYHFAQWHEWSASLARLAPEDLVVPGSKFTSEPNYYGQVGYGATKLPDYRNWVFQQTVKDLKDDPDIVDWLEPHGEIGPFHDTVYWDFSELNRQALVKWLQEDRKYDLKSLQKAWYGDEKKLKSWDDVQIPMDYSFYGWEKDSIMAAPQWRRHMGTLEEGIERGYYKDDLDDTKWVTFDMPGGEVPALSWRPNKMLWYRGTIDVPEKWLAQRKKDGGRIYLNAIPLVNSRGWNNPDKIWVNGEEVGSLFTAPGYENAGQIDVTDILRPGKNTITYAPPYGGYGMRGPFFLATKPLEKYPFSDSHTNARYYDWHEFVASSANQRVADTCAAIRAIDPDRPIKIHAAYYKDLMGQVMAKYGGFGHNTGEGSFLRAWDRRLGYPRGIGASAEFGGSITSEVGLKRWIGFFTFEGLTALDNFHNIQAMMYSPAAPVWKEYMPYIKLAPRRDIKKPDIALISSSANNQLLPRNFPYIFDLGRGDLQSLGYSYVYVDEPGIAEGLAADYPVLWDTGTAIMSKETVNDIRKYVENGGTFVAIQETGRHTFTERDAWPISDLTGFAVREIRPMEGLVSILRDQPIFKNLAGKSFYNRGKSVDYSNYNFADKSLVLEPIVPEAKAVARYEDGSVAIGVRKIGKGQVIVLGSPFWRDSYDKGGLWWPGEQQSAFLEDVFTGLGLKPLATANTREIWREHYISNNGTEEYLALWNPYDVEKTVSLEWATVNPVSGLYDPKNGKEIPGKIEGKTVSITDLKLAPYETLIVAAQSNRAPVQAVGDWFTLLAKTWKPSAQGEVLKRPDVPEYEIPILKGVQSRILSGDETIDLAAVSSQATPGAGWSDELGFIRTENLNLNLNPDQKVGFHCPINLPAGWQKGDTYELVFRPYWRDNLLVSAFVNGKEILTVDKPGTKDKAVDISSALNFDGERANVLACTAPSAGYLGEIKIVRKPKPSEILEVKGEWTVQTSEDDGLAKVQLPGTMKGLFAMKDDVVIPENWKGSRVFIQIDPAKAEEYNAFAINDKMVFHPVSYYSPVTYMDITPWVKFGESNRLTLVPKAAAANWVPGQLTIDKVELQKVDHR